MKKVFVAAVLLAFAAMLSSPSCALHAYTSRDVAYPIPLPFLNFFDSGGFARGAGVARKWPGTNTYPRYYKNPSGYPYPYAPVYAQCNPVLFPEKPPYPVCR